MKTRKHVCVLLISAIIFNIFGCQIMFFAFQQKIRNEIRQQILSGILQEKLTLIVASSKNETNIIWTRPNKEFSFHGEMYDVVRVEKNNHHCYYYCLSDHKEKQLIANYQKLQNRKRHTDEKMKRSINTLLFLQQNNSSGALISKVFKYRENPCNVLENFIIIPSPPPKSA